MERLIKYFDRIKADEELIEKTKSYIRERIALENRKNASLSMSPHSVKVRRQTFRKLSVAAFSLAACAVFMIGGYAYYRSPVNYISLDINPSVELGLNHFDRVVETEGLNADGTNLINEAEIMNMSADNAIEKLALEAEEKGFIREDGSTVIAVTALSDQEEEAAKIRDQMDETLRTMVANGTLNAVIYADNADLQMRMDARELGFSPGKYKLILLLQSLDPGIEMEQYRNARITDILVNANELLLKNGSVEDVRYEWSYRLIQEAAERVLEINGNVKTEQNTEEQNTEQQQSRNVSPSALEQKQPQNNDGYNNQIQAISPKSKAPESSPPSIELKETETQTQMTNQSDEGQTHLNKPETDSDGQQGEIQPPNQSSEGKGGNQNNTRNPN